MADESSAQREISELLARQESPRMPDDVRDRILAAIDAEQDGRGNHRRSRRGWILPLGAAAGFAVLAGVVLLPQVDQTDDAAPMAAANCQVTVSRGGDLTPVAHSTGTTYTQAGFAAQTRQMMGGGAACERAAEQDSGGSEAVRQAAAPELSECLFAVIPGQPVIAVDRARYGGQDVLVTVVAAAPNRALVVDCSPPPPRVVRDALLP